MSTPTPADGPDEVRARGDLYLNVKNWEYELCDEDAEPINWSDWTYYGQPPGLPWGDGMLNEHWWFGPYNDTHDFRDIWLYQHKVTGQIMWFVQHLRREWLTPEASWHLRSFAGTNVTGAHTAAPRSQRKFIDVRHQASNPASERDFSYWNASWAAATTSEAMAGRGWGSNPPPYTKDEEALSPYGAPQHQVQTAQQNTADNWIRGVLGTGTQMCYNFSSTQSWYKDGWYPVVYAVNYYSWIMTQSVAADFTPSKTSTSPWPTTGTWHQDKGILGMIGVFPDAPLDEWGEFDWYSDLGKSIYSVEFSYADEDFFGVSARFQACAWMPPLNTGQGNIFEQWTPTPIYFSKHPYEVYENLDASNVHFGGGEILSTRVVAPGDSGIYTSGTRDGWPGTEWQHPYMDHEIWVDMGPDDESLKWTLNATTGHLVSPPEPIAPYAWPGVQQTFFFHYGSDVRTLCNYRGQFIHRRAFITFYVCPEEEEECPPHLRLLQRSDVAKGPFENVPTRPDCGKALRLKGRDVQQNLVPGNLPRTQPNSYP